ncbi:MAG: hypothetical protein AMXMBFR33_35970 [Candidatus Xenobia bacterium]
MLFVLVALGVAQPPSATPTPEPAPTNAADQAQQRVTVEGYGAFPVGVSQAQARQMAGQVALLSAYRQLTLKARAFSQPRQEGNELQEVTVSAQHGSPAWLAWALRAEPVTAVEEGRGVKVTLKSPPLGEIASTTPFLSRTSIYDIDRDGVNETIGAGYDGRIYVLREQAGRLRVLAATPGYAELHSSVRNQWEHVLLTRLDSLSSIEPAGRGRVRVVAHLSRTEAVGGFLAGAATEEREVLVTLDKNEPAPDIQVSEPLDFTPVDPDKIPLKGLLTAPSRLSKAVLMVNGTQVWSSPPRLQARSLKLDLMLDLIPGFNRALLQVVDSQNRPAEREVVVYRRGEPTPLKGQQKRALVVGVESYPDGKVAHAVSDAQAMARALVEKAGFPAQQVSTLEGPAATRDAIAKAMGALTFDSGQQDLVVFYFAGMSGLNSLGNKQLMASDTQPDSQNGVSAEDLQRFLNDLPTHNVVVLLDTARVDKSEADSRWLANDDFLTRSGGIGRLILSSGDPSPSERVGSGSSGVVTRKLVEGLGGQTGGTVQELYRFAYEGVAREAAERKVLPILPLLRGRPVGVQSLR